MLIVCANWGWNECLSGRWPGCMLSILYTAADMAENTQTWGVVSVLKAALYAMLIVCCDAHSQDQLHSHKLCYCVALGFPKWKCQDDTCVACAEHICNDTCTEYIHYTTYMHLLDHIIKSVILYMHVMCVSYLHAIWTFTITLCK